MNHVMDNRSHPTEFSYRQTVQDVIKHVKVEYLIAGTIGGGVSTLALQPLDVIKTRFAVNNGRSPIPKYDGIWNAFRTIYEREGIRGLYRGAVPNVCGSSAAWGLYFVFYNAIKMHQQRGNAEAVLHASQHLAAAAEAGTLTLFITNPLWVVKTRLCLQTDHTNTRYRGMWDALLKIYREEGVIGYYRGLLPGIFGVSHGALQFTVYELLKTELHRYKHVSNVAKLNTAEYLFCAATSKLIAAGVTYPYQVIRARLQNQYYSYGGVSDCVRKTWHGEGWRGFYKGLSANLTRVVPATMITFVTYENLIDFLNTR